MWLRAKGKGDEDDARSLTGIDPGIRARLAALYAIDRLEQLDGRDRREAFEALWDAHFAHLLARAR